jgi:hypothetical protein
MKTRRHLITYLLLNGLVSAAVVSTILFIYNRIYQQDCAPVLAIATSQAGTPLPGVGRVEILSVLGAGSPADEVLVVRNSGSETLVLTGWYLKDEQSGKYEFPQLTLFPGGMVRVHTDGGVDTASDLHWASATPVWSSGELAVLYDAQDVARAFYRIP